MLHECSHPVAAWSIVLEGAATPPERAVLGQLTLGDVQSVASRCAVLHCGNVPRKRRVNRAKLSALAVLFRAHPAATVHTDSQYAKTIVCAVAGNPDIRMFHRAKNFDLCETFQGTLDRPCVLWIGSHQAPEKHFSPEYNLAIVGNTVADTAANFARRCSPQELLRPVMAARAHVKAHTERCLQLMTCVAELSEAKWIKQSKMPKQTSHGALAPDADLPQGLQEHSSRWVCAREALQRIGVGHLARDLPSVSPDLHPFLCWGVEYMRVLHAWVSSLTWPPVPVDRDPGVNLVELWTNFRITTQETVPVNTGTKNVPVYKTRRHDPALFLQPGDADTVLPRKADVLIGLRLRAVSRGAALAAHEWLQHTTFPMIEDLVNSFPFSTFTKWCQDQELDVDGPMGPVLATRTARFRQITATGRQAGALSHKAALPPLQAGEPTPDEHFDHAWRRRRDRTPLEEEPMLDADLRFAAACCARRRGQMIDLRRQAAGALRELKQRWQGVTATLRERQPATIRRVTAQRDVGFTALLIILSSWTDVSYPYGLICGLPAVGYAPPYGIFPEQEHVASVSRKW